ncbi:hypothetical protein EC991_009280 [Linnemannia zychae]|nr:hypothetical protein EC991_009280 [Linnemannia zychae]
MEAQVTQAVRRVYEDEETTDNPTSRRNIHIICHPDASIGKDIILWDDILAVFSTALYVRSGIIALPFLKGSNFKNLDPLRIAAVPGVTLDVVVKGQSGEKDVTMVSLQKALPIASQENNAKSTATSLNADTTRVRRNPAGGLVEKAMDAYRDNINPAFGPKLRGPQALVGDEDGSPTSDTPPASQALASRTQTPSLHESESSDSGDFHVTMKKATLGDKDAQYALGDMYYYAKGAQLDYNVAVEWYIKAANQGHAEAQNGIGFMYFNGQGVPQDYAAAMEWYRKAADQGLAAAQCNIGCMYLYGLGVPQDYSVALDWFHKAANQGNSEAQYEIGIMYRHGQGVPQDFTAAMEWYHKAANNGLANAFNNIGVLYDQGLGVPQSDSLAMEWYRKAADQGSSSAQYNIGMMFEIGQGVPKDIAAAVEWYKKAVVGGQADAEEALSKIVETRKISNSTMTDSVKVKKKVGLFRSIFN